MLRKSSNAVKRLGNYSVKRQDFHFIFYSMLTESSDRYVCLRKLGQGCGSVNEVNDRGYGDVFVAQDKVSYNQVALKKIHLATNGGEFEGEAELLKSCESNFIVRYYNLVHLESELWVTHG